jgi:membrane fusion protein (multidrug efflux system)
MPYARLAAAVLLAGLLAGCRKSAPPPEAEKIPPAPVKWEGIRQLVLEEWTDLVGTTEPLPDHAARVTAPVEGRVLAVLSGAAGKPIAEGQLVEAGTVLVKLDDTVLRATRDKAVAAKKVLQAEKEASDFAVKQADVEVRRLTDLKRQQDARPGGLQLVAPIELEKANLGLDAAQAHARADVVRLAAADDEIAALDRQLRLYTLTAPRKGRLGRLQVVVGQTLTPGMPVAEVIDVEDEINVLCFVPSSDARKLQVGQSARIGGVDRDPADAGADPEGKVEFIADQAEVESGLIAVKVRFPNGDLKLRANTVTRLRVLTKPDKACWAIPEAALMEDSDPPSVVVVEDKEEKPLPNGKVEETGKARRLRAIIGIRDRVKKQVEIVRLEDPEKKWKGDLETAVIVVEKGQGLQTGDPVKLEMEEDEEPPPMPEEKK